MPERGCSIRSTLTIPDVTSTYIHYDLRKIVYTPKELQDFADKLTETHGTRVGMDSKGVRARKVKYNTVSGIIN